MSVKSKRSEGHTQSLEGTDFQALVSICAVETRVVETGWILASDTEHNKGGE